MTSPHITRVTDATFEQEVLKSDKLVLIDFYADWCAPCQALAPTLEKFAEDHADSVKVVKVNVEDSPQLVKDFGVQGIPLLVTMKDGQPVYGALGALPAEKLEEFVAASFAKASTPPPPAAGGQPPAPKGPAL